jgi:hypothetical protein
MAPRSTETGQRAGPFRRPMRWFQTRSKLRPRRLSIIVASFDSPKFAPPRWSRTPFAQASLPTGCADSTNRFCRENRKMIREAPSIRYALDEAQNRGSDAVITHYACRCWRANSRTTKPQPPQTGIPAASSRLRDGIRASADGAKGRALHSCERVGPCSFVDSSALSLPVGRANDTR